MKTHFKSSEIAHIWAHKSAPFGKSDGAMSFNGDSFFSYSTVIARHLTFKGRSAVILNDTGYSVTTAKHQSLVRRAIPGNIPVFRISGLDRGTSLSVDGKTLFEYAIHESAECLKKAERAKGKKATYESEAAQWLERAQEINAFFGLRRKVDAQAIERLKASSLEAERKERAARAAREMRERIDQQLAFDHWLNGEPSEYFNARLFPVAFRVEGEELVSTLGARIPLADARMALRFVQSHRGGNWNRNGEVMRVGHYQLDSISPDGVKAGCHHITWAEIDRLHSIL